MSNLPLISQFKHHRLKEPNRSSRVVVLVGFERSVRISYRVLRFFFEKNLKFAFLISKSHIFLVEAGFSIKLIWFIRINSFKQLSNETDAGPIAGNIT